MKIFGYEIKKVEKESNKAKAVDENGNPVEAETVDKNGKPVDKPSFKETAGKVLGTVLKVGTIGGMVAGAYVFGGKKVSKSKDAEIRQLKNNNEELTEELAEAWAKIPAETGEAEEPETKEDESEVTYF